MAYKRLNNENNAQMGIYIHVPFCAKKCPYCDFYSGAYTLKKAEDYTAAVIRNIKNYSESGITADTVYFGGGTPSLLPVACFKKILSAVYDTFSVDAENSEITIEANPRTLNADKLYKLRQLGINRLSIGVQSCVQQELQALGRNHSYDDVKHIITNAHDAGFNNISCDIMMGVPYQTADSLAFSIEKLSELPITHISAYILKIEEGTAFDSENIRSLIADDDTAAEIYLGAVKLLSKHGFNQYEISNFAKDGFESRHNLKYWLCREYLGIGPFAHSYLYGKRFFVDMTTDEFIAEPLQKIRITDNEVGTDFERAMLGLRLKCGINLNDYDKEFADNIRKKSDKLKNEGYLSLDGDRVSFTEKGFLMSNSLIEWLIM